MHYILAEVCMGGMVLETNMSEILTRIEEQSKLEKQEVRFFIAADLIVLLSRNISLQLFCNSEAAASELQERIGNMFSITLLVSLFGIVLFNPFEMSDCCNNT